MKPIKIKVKNKIREGILLDTFKESGIMMGMFQYFHVHGIFVVKIKIDDIIKD